MFSTGTNLASKTQKNSKKCLFSRKMAQKNEKKTAKMNLVPATKSKAKKKF